MTEKKEDVKNQVENEMHKKGRDGAYLEADVSKLGSLVKDIVEGKSLPKMIVLTGFRLELSDPNNVASLLYAIKQVSKTEPDMTDDQIGLKAFRDIVEAGLTELGSSE